MSFSIQRASQNEIARIEMLGWTDAPVDSDGIYSYFQIDESEISFPSDGYENDQDVRESEGIWASTRAEVIAEILTKHGKSVIWEVGAGHGNVALPLSESQIVTIPIEPLSAGARALAAKGFHVFGHTLEDLKLPDSCLDAVGLFDVLEHLENPDVVLAEVFRVLAPGGLLLTSVPAYQWLFSRFDISIGHFRRYSRKNLFNTLASNGFVDIKLQNLFLLFIFPAFIMRRLPYLLGQRRMKIRQASSDKSVLRVLSPLLNLIIKIERKLNLPLGLSILSSAIKP